MRSVVVVLPASIWAMIPMFRVRASGYSRMTRGLPAPVGARPVVSFAACAMSSFLAGVAISGLPPVMGERPVRLRHLVHVFLALDRGPGPARSVHELRGQSLGHAVLATRPGVVDQPAERERRSAGGPNLDRHLVRRTTDPARADLEQRPRVLHRPLQRDRRVVRGLLADVLERLVHDALRETALAREQHLVDELRDELVLVDRVRIDLAPGRGSLAWHLPRLLLRGLGAVPRAGLLAIANARGGQGAADA